MIIFLISREIWYSDIFFGRQVYPVADYSYEPNFLFAVISTNLMNILKQISVDAGCFADLHAKTFMTT